MSRGRSPKRELVANRDFFLEVTKVPLSDFLTAMDPDPGYLE